MPDRRDALLPLILAVGLAVWAVGGDEARSSSNGPVRASAAAKAEAAGLPDCTRPGEAINFDVFTLGERFDGLAQTASLRRCDRPELLPQGVTARSAGGPRHTIRANYASLLYGDCEATADSGCARPLEIQTWPACERNPGLYDRGEGDAIRIRGAPARRFDDGASIEIYTGRTTVVVFGDDRGLVARAARSVVPVAVGSRFPMRVSATAARARKRALPPAPRAAMTDRLPCRAPAAAARAGGGI